MPYAFLFDASSCSGCKACQVACKDKNQLPLGVLWRRVYEVSGGAWKQDGAAWANTVFGYNLSLSCNHCEHPKCAGVCPVDAYTVREDGIVLLDSSRCMGCGYCAWACPYGAPQYNRAAGTMTKCDFCYEDLDAGLAPACVAACPLRVLDYAEVGDGQTLPADRIALWDVPAETHPYPLPASSHTQPHLAIKPHAAMSSPALSCLPQMSVQGQSRILPLHAHLGEVAKPVGVGEAPLVGFTLLVQMAVGGFWALLWLLADLQSQFLPLLLIGLCLGAGLMTSFAHLGNKRNAWRALNHLWKSWLSREILFTLLFGAGWLATMAASELHIDFPLWGALTALLGLLLLHCMSQVYRLASVPAWNSWRTEAQFFLSAALLGILGMAAVLARLHTPLVPWMQIGAVAIVLLLAQAVMERSGSFPRRSRSLRLELILMGMIGCAAVFFIPGASSRYSSLAVLLIVLAEQALARWLFYQARR